jgi:hypothetical protein
MKATVDPVCLIGGVDTVGWIDQHDKATDPPRWLVVPKMGWHGRKNGALRGWMVIQS